MQLAYFRISIEVISDICISNTYLENFESGMFPVTYRLPSSPFKNTLLWSFVASYISMVAICELHSSTYSILNTISSTYITSSHIYDQQIHREIGLIPTYGNKIRKGTVKRRSLWRITDWRKESMMTEKGCHFDLNLWLFSKINIPRYSNENNFSSPKKLLP